jgi:hypothetical protein
MLLGATSATRPPIPQPQPPSPRPPHAQPAHPNPRPPEPSPHRPTIVPAPHRLQALQAPAPPPGPSPAPQLPQQPPSASLRRRWWCQTCSGLTRTCGGGRPPCWKGCTPGLPQAASWKVQKHPDGPPNKEAFDDRRAARTDSIKASRRCLATCKSSRWPSARFTEMPYRFALGHGFPTQHLQRTGLRRHPRDYVDSTRVPLERGCAEASPHPPESLSVSPHGGLSSCDVVASAAVGWTKGRDIQVRRAACWVRPRLRATRRRTSSRHARPATRWSQALEA